MKQPFLGEIGTEELPPKSLSTLATSLHDGIVSRLAAHGLSHGPSRWFATPRRLAVLIEELDTQAEDSTEVILGPPASAARSDDGNWTPAAIGFAKKQGLEPADLQIINSDKGDRLGVSRILPGAKTEQVLAPIVDESLQHLPIAKRMRWGASRTEFVRPVHWVVAIYGNNSSLGTIFGINTSNESRGHRFHGPERIVIESPASYESTLERAKVIACFERRKSLILSQVHACAKALDAEAQIDPELLEEVTALVEWPVALSGAFDSGFLRVPAEALIASMKEHQKYFHLRAKDGALLPNFITVANIESPEPERIVKGNERVIRPRLSDAAFFYDSDLKSSLNSRNEQLAKMTFQESLGSVADKVARVKQLALEIATQISANENTVAVGAELCKSDLPTELVGEFPELQGIAGAYYARAEDLSDEIATVIEEHYLPRFAGDKLPSTKEAICVALADRLDTLAGIFAVGEIPSGSKDPYGLRRASLACLRLIIETGLELDLKSLVNCAFRLLPFESKPESSSIALDYIVERFYSRYESEGIEVTTIRSVLNKDIYEPLDMHQRILAAHGFLSVPECGALASAYKRVSNILGKSDERLQGDYQHVLLAETAEVNLVAAIDKLAPELNDLLNKKDYRRYLTVLASMRETVDAFFDDVMVNVEDSALKRNRLAILCALQGLFGAVADLKELAS
jgi:glycyl-tRNA synthetase beta chain